MTVPDLKHWSWPDDPPNGRDNFRTACGCWRRARDLAVKPEAITCPACKAELAAFESLEIG